MRFKIFSVKVYISFWFVAFLSAFIIVDKTGFIIPIAIASFIHEVGHLLCMYILDCQPKEINILSGGIQIISCYEPKRKNNILILLSGPMANILVFLLFYIDFCAFKDETYIVFCLINLLLGIFNLLPLRGLDGGSIIFSLFGSDKNSGKGDTIISVITFICALCVIFTAVIMSLLGKTNLNIYIIALYLILSVIFKF